MDTQNEIRKVRIRKELDELQSLGIDPRRENELNDELELEELISNIKQAMYADYKLAYGEKGEKHREEATATVNI